MSQSKPFALTSNIQTDPFKGYTFVDPVAAGDGDPLAVIIYTRTPMAPGTLIKLRAIGVLTMIDGGDKDE